MLETATIEIQKTKQSRLSELDADNMPFGKHFSDHMFVVDYRDGEWQLPKIIPYGNMQLSPAMSALHYGQSIFEGMKAHKNSAGDVLLFRPLYNHERFNQSAERMCMPHIPEKLFMDGLVQLLQLDSGWVLAKEECSLYIRPVMFATDEFIGVRESQTYRFVIFTCPVGPYYKNPVKVLIETKYARAFEGGIGFTKAAANYGVSLYPTRLAHEKGYQQLIWTEAKEHKYIEESGVMNVMFVIGDTLITPALNNTILPGKTRDSILTIAKDWKMKVEERKVSVEEIIAAFQNGSLKEAFGVGTAATVAQIITIGYNGKDYQLPATDDNAFFKRVANHLTDIRKGKAADIHNWIYKV